jgi:predicted RNA-binding Zn-ribbon protein involved in translation (DUF1610 family)
MTFAEKNHSRCRSGLGLAFLSHHKDRTHPHSHFSVSLNAAIKVWVRFSDMYNLTKCVAMASATARRLLVVSTGGTEMTDVEPNEIEFQCPNCGNDLSQTIENLKAEKHMTCPGCGMGINIDTDRLANAAEEIRKAIEKSPPEITIKFYR